LVGGCPKLVDAPVRWHTLTMLKSGLSTVLQKGATSKELSVNLRDPPSTYSDTHAEEHRGVYNPGFSYEKVLNVVSLQACI